MEPGELYKLQAAGAIARRLMVRWETGAIARRLIG